MFQRFCKSAISASRQRENFMESLHSGSSATYLLIIWVEKILPLAMKSKQKPYPSIVFLSIFPLNVYINSGICTILYMPLICKLKDIEICFSFAVQIIVNRFLYLRHKFLFLSSLSVIGNTHRLNNFRHCTDK